ncbi:amidohydrolase [Parahaliea maris]|uniref:Amidohydrolase n=1 Tax=Parahaliea maris TaxID=2716870 RepID=A0A5C8ZZE2_9GAMM|nr:amidohydrolase [Parahaliea maris]TXS92900.1 amidohydrolase [Parahaliea maris]
MLRFCYSLALAGILAFPPFSTAADTADLIYSGGPILTMNDAQPTAEAIAVADGKIIAVGTGEAIKPFIGEQTKQVDLQGQTLLPGFVDSHGHAFLIGFQSLSANLLPPPDGEGENIDALVGLLQDWTKKNQDYIDQYGWIVGFGYDNAQLAEQRHPTRQDLDRVSTDLPVLIVHQSGHLGVANSKALDMLGVTADTPNPDGGVFQREADGKQPNGVAEEYAFFRLVGGMSQTWTPELQDRFVVEGTKVLASFGYTTGQEGRANGQALAAMERMADADKLRIDLVAYPDILEVMDIAPSRSYTHHFRVGGAKLTIDGSPQGKTAWLTQPYYVPPPGQDKDYVGYPAISHDQAMDAVDKAFANNWQILVHCNGDAAIDLLIEAVAAARKKYPDVHNRPVLIHGQTLRKDQVGKIKSLKIFPSLFPMHTFYWGDYHRDSVLGPERAENISPTGWLMDENMMFGTHHDAPVALPDSMRVLSATVTRRSRSGAVIGPQHRVSVATALKAMTIWSAWQHFEEDRKGTLEGGKLADFVILSDNPMTVDPELLDNLKVQQSIKEGVPIYTREE